MCAAAHQFRSCIQPSILPLQRGVIGRNGHFLLDLIQLLATPLHVPAQHREAEILFAAKMVEKGTGRYFGRMTITRAASRTAGGTARSLCR